MERPRAGAFLSVSCSYYLQNGLFVEPSKATILRQPRFSSKPSPQMVSLKLTDWTLGMILAATSAAASLTSSFTSVVISLAFSIYSSSCFFVSRQPPLWVALCVYKENYDAPSWAAHCQNYLFC